MVARSQREIRQRAPWWLVGLLFLNFAVMAFDARDEASQERLVRVWASAIASPLQRLTAGAGGAGSGLLQRIRAMRHATAENEQLRSQVQQMETELRETRAAVKENERLNSLLGLKDSGQFGVIPARVIARDSSIWFDTVMIDQGRAAGVDLNMPVVTPDGVVGRVVATSLWTAQIMLITDERAAAGAIVGQVGQSAAIGSVKGTSNSGVLEMRFVSGLEPVKPGDVITTTGQDGFYPEGLKVGEVIGVKSGSATVPHVIYVRPSARLDALYEVAVLSYQPRRVPPDQTIPNLEKSKK